MAFLFFLNLLRLNFNWSVFNLYPFHQISILLFITFYITVQCRLSSVIVIVKFIFTVLSPEHCIRFKFLGVPRYTLSKLYLRLIFLKITHLNGSIWTNGSYFWENEGKNRWGAAKGHNAHLFWLFIWSFIKCRCSLCISYVLVGVSFIC